MIYLDIDCKQYWCPDSRVNHSAPVNRSPKGDLLPGTECIGKRCGKWRWKDEDLGQGYCGAASIPWEAQDNRIHIMPIDAAREIEKQIGEVKEAHKKELSRARTAKYRETEKGEETKKKFNAKSMAKYHAAKNAEDQDDEETTPQEFKMPSIATGEE